MNKRISVGIVLDLIIGTSGVVKLVALNAPYLASSLAFVAGGAVIGLFSLIEERKGN
jgi:hypothetical protein